VLVDIIADIHYTFSPMAVAKAIGKGVESESTPSGAADRPQLVALPRFTTSPPPPAYRRLPPRFSLSRLHYRSGSPPLTGADEQTGGAAGAIAPPPCLTAGSGSANRSGRGWRNW
jgi:hypothetical protein